MTCTGRIIMKICSRLTYNCAHLMFGWGGGGSWCHKKRLDHISSHFRSYFCLFLGLQGYLLLPFILVCPFSCKNLFLSTSFFPIFPFLLHRIWSFILKIWSFIQNFFSFSSNFTIKVQYRGTLKDNLFLFLSLRPP